MHKGMNRNLNRMRTTEKILMPVGLIIAAGVAVWVYFFFKDLKVIDRIGFGVFAFIMLSRFITGGIPKIIFHDKRVHRTLFLLLWPVGGVLVLYLLYQWWHIGWLAALIGLVLGFFISVFVGLLFFKDVAQEDQVREEKVSEFLTEEVLEKNPDAVAMRQRFSGSEWQNIRTFPNMLLGMISMSSAKNSKAVVNAYAEALVKPEKYSDPLMRMMLIDYGADVSDVTGKLDGITRLSTAVSGGILEKDFENLAQSGKLTMGQEGFFTFKPEDMHTIKNCLSQDEFRSFIRDGFRYAMDLMNAQGKPSVDQEKMVLEFFSKFAESKQDLFSILGVRKS